jgi:hypothetical protein
MSNTKKARKSKKPSESGKGISDARQLSGEELGALANRLANAKSKREAKAITEEMVRGFYGRA